jgi:copper transport protein
VTDGLAVLGHGMRMALLAFAILVTTIGGALAHAGLVRSDPADGAVLADAPIGLTLTFSEPVVPLALRLVIPDGHVIELRHHQLAGGQLRIAVPKKLEAGTHVLSWRVTSEDGHPVAGSVVFSNGAPSTRLAIAEPVDWPVRTAIWIVRVLVYLSLFFGIGGSFALAWLSVDRTRGSQVTGLAIALGFLVIPLAVGLQGLDALGTSWNGLFTATPWQAGFMTSYGNSAIVGFLSLVLAALSLWAGPVLAKPLAGFALIGVGLALASTGHASAAPPHWLTKPAVFLHGVSIAFWLGALVPLSVALRRHDTAGTIMLLRFSRWAPLAVLPLILAGLILAIVQLGSPAALIETAYGQVLALKLVLLFLLFGLACLNRWRLTPQLATGRPTATLDMRRSILAEVVLAILILGTVATWRFTPPPRMLAQLAAEPARLHVHGEKAMAELTIFPGRAGVVSASMAVMTGDFGPLDPKAITLVLANLAAGIEPFKRKATKSADGTWHIDQLTIPVPGRWSARIDILVSDFELVKLEDTIEIRP